MKRVLVIAVVVCLLAGVTAALLVRYGSGEPSWQGRPIHAWVADLQSGNPELRERAVQALNAMGPEAAEYLSGQIGRQPGALERFARKASEYVPGVFKRAARRVYNPWKPVLTQHAAAKAIEAMGTNGIVAVPALGRMLHNENVLLSGTAGVVLGEMGPASLPVLIRALDDQDYNVRSSACSALARLGTNAAPAAPRLCAIVGHETGGPILSSAAYALFRIGPPAAAEVLKLLQSTNSAARERAAWALGGSVSVPEVRRALIEVAERESGTVRWTAISALAYADPGEPEVAAAMLHFLTDSEAQVRTTALTAFLYQPRLVLRNLPLFIHLLDDPSPEVRARAARAIRQTGERGREAIPALEKLLNDSEFQVRTAAAEALGAMTNSSLVVSGTREVTAPARSASSQQIAPE